MFKVGDKLIIKDSGEGFGEYSFEVLRVLNDQYELIAVRSNERPKLTVDFFAVHSLLKLAITELKNV